MEILLTTGKWILVDPLQLQVSVTMLLFLEHVVKDATFVELPNQRKVVVDTMETCMGRD